MLRNQLRAFLIVSGILFLLIPAQSVMVTSKSQQGGAASHPLRMTLPVPPNSLNEMTVASGTSGYYITELELAGASPVVFPNGSLDWQQSFTKSISHNSNYTQWIFNVNPDLKWSDGTNASAQDILATFGPKFGFIPSYDILSLGSEVKDEYALNTTAAVYDLNITDAHFADKLAPEVFTSIYPASFINQGGANGTNFGTDIGVGPFYVSNYTQGSFQMVMLRNPYFTPQPAITELDINFVDSLSLTSSYLLSGTTDLAPVEPSNAKSVLNDPNLGLLDDKGFSITTIQYNDSVYPYNMTAFRQALAFGINQSAYVQEAFQGYGLPAYNAEGILSPISKDWYNPNTMHYAYNSTQALSLLQSAGMTKGSDGFIHYSNGSVVTLSLWTDTDQTQDVVGAGVVQQNLQSLGFKVNLVTTSVGNLISDYGANSQNIRSGMIIYTNTVPVWGAPYLDAEPGWLVYWVTVTSDPYWEYPPSADAEFQGNYSAFRATANVTMEKTYLDNIQSLNAQYLPTIVLAYPDILWAYNKQHWTNWNFGYLDYGAQELNWTALANLRPVGEITQTTSSASQLTSPSSSSSSTIASTSQPSMTSSSTTTQSGSSMTNYIYLGVAVVIVVILAAAAVTIVRRRQSKKGP